MTPRTGSGDPARTLELLWRGQAGDRRRPGPRPRLTVDTVVDEAIAAADAVGLDALTMRALADRLGVSPMTLYTYVPGKAELLDLMVDALYAAMPREPWRAQQRWRRRLEAVAEANHALYAAHPWAARISTARPPLGPGQTAKYEHELQALDGLGLSDVEMDSALTFLLGFVQAAAAARLDHVGDDGAWWEQAGPLLERVLDADRYPLAVRVGAAAGEAQGAAYDPRRAYEFGLERVLDGLGALIERRGGGPQTAPARRPPT